MRKTLFFILVISLTGRAELFSQGWVAEITVDINHGLYAFEKIDAASVTFSGVTTSGSSQTSSLQVVIRGDDLITGNLSLTVYGMAFEPYDRDEPYSQQISGTLSGTFTDLCSRGLFQKTGMDQYQQISVWIEIFPRLEIAEFTNNCDALTFTTNTCSTTYTWGVSESLSGNFRIIPGKTTPSITITRSELDALGFDDPFGRKYFTVTGKTGTTSPLQPIDIYYPPASASVTSISPKCHNGADGSVQVDIISPAPSLIKDFVVTLFPDDPAERIRQQYLSNQSTFTFLNLKAGSYSVTVENQSNLDLYGNCSAEYAADALENPEELGILDLEVSDYHGYQVTCHGSADGSIRARASGGTGTYIFYEWTPNVSTRDLAQDLSAGSYAVRVKDSNQCWSKQYSQKLSEPEMLSVEMISAGGKNGYDVSCHDKTDGLIETGLSGGVPDYSFYWSDGTGLPQLKNAGAGDYSVTVTDGNGCTNTASMTLMAPEPIDFMLTEVSPIHCPGGRTGALMIQSPANTIGNVYCSWSTGDMSFEITGQTSGQYTASVSDDQGCTTTKNHTLTEPPAYVVELVAVSDYNGTPISCHQGKDGKVASIVKDSEDNIVSPTSYTWYRNGAELISGNSLSGLDGLSSGEYTLEVTYGASCKAESSFLLNEPDPVVASVSAISNYNGFPVSCHGQSDGSIQATAVGGTGDVYVYSWDGGATGSLLTGVGAGTFVVTATDINGCRGTSKKILKSPQPVNAMISVLSDHHGQPLSCAGAADARLRGEATGGVPAFNYAWTSGERTQDLSDVPAGYYSLTAIDANGCTAVADTTIIDPAPVKGHIAEASNFNGYGISCHGAMDGYLLSTGSGGTGIYNFRWEGTTHTAPRYEHLPAGTYKVTVEDQNGCTGTMHAIITAPEPLSLEVLSIQDISCNRGEDGVIELSSAGGTGRHVYTLDKSHWQPEPVINELKAGSYQPAVKDLNGCLKTISQTLVAPEAIAIHFKDVEPARCGEPLGKATAVADGGSGDYRYEWTNAEHEVIADTPTLSGVYPGVFTIRVIDAHRCELLEAVGITSLDGPEATINEITPASCFHSSDGSALLSAAGNGPFSFTWPDGENTSKRSDLGKGDYLVEIQDTNDCISVQQVTISAPDSLEITLVEKEDPQCHSDCNGKIVVSAKGGNGNYSFLWKNASGPEASDLCAGHHEVMATDMRGCVSKRTFSLIQPEAISVKLLSAQNPNCANACDGLLEVTASGGTGLKQFEWNIGSPGPAIKGLCAGIYSVTATDAHQCVAADTIALENPPDERIDLGGSITLCAGQHHVLDPGAYWQRYSWGSNTGFTSDQRRIKISEAGSYWLEAISSKGCEVRDTFLLMNSEALLKANFLLASEAMIGDTIVAIDVSWPLPENIIWKLPPEMKRLYDYGDIVHGTFEKSGQYPVSLTALLGQCNDDIMKHITILSDSSESTEDDRLGHEDFVTEFALYPNPNDGAFDVSIKFAEESFIVLSVWSTLTARKVFQTQNAGKTSYLQHIDATPLSAGAYSLRMDYSKGTKFIRFMVK